MNQSMLVIGDFEPLQIGSIQLIDIQDFSFPKLFRQVYDTHIHQTFFIRTKHPKAIFEAIKKDVTFVKAAGGIVRNSSDQYLFIYRLGKWDLPKGKVEKAERYDVTALREVEEECGIHPTLAERKPYSTYHSYMMDGEIVIKKTKWYEMYVENIPVLIPQIEEDITEARWCSSNDLYVIKKNTYPLIKELLKEKIENE